MRNFWLEKKEAKEAATKKRSEGHPTVCMWDFNTALGDEIKNKYESEYVKVVEINNIGLNNKYARRWQRMEMLSNGGSLIFKDMIHAGSWEFTEEFNKEMEKTYPKIYGWKTPTKHQFTFADAEPKVERAIDATMHQPVGDDELLPPWNTETYKGWECDL